MHMYAIPIVHLFAGLAIYRYFDPNALAAVIGIEWFSVRVAALHAIGPHHAAFYLAVFPTLLFSLVYFTPVQRAKIEAKMPPKVPEFHDTNSRLARAFFADNAAFTAFTLALGFLVQFGGVVEASYSRWWGMLFPGILLNTWMGAVGLVTLALILSGLIKD